jgi:tRNA dimethylallyltransferase
MIIAVVGATGTGKSALALDIAESLGEAESVQAVSTGSTNGGAETRPSAEIVNADAMQLYRGMDIGTAKVPESERRGIPHHLLDVLDVSEEASVADYQRDARAAIEGIESRGATPILVGGSGLYVSSVLFDFEFPGTDPAIRSNLEQQLDTHGPGMLFQRLAELDPAAAASIGSRNGRRIVRALEVIELTGQPFGAGLPSEEKYWRPTVVIGLQEHRDALVHRLDRRVEQMWAAGLKEEAASLGALGVTAARAIGYAQALDQLRGEESEKDAIEQAQALTRRYARRQVGWFKRYPGVTWIDSTDPRRIEIAMNVIAMRMTAAETSSGNS